MMRHAALVIVYNHRYEKNIDILERIYASRFSHIYHLMPFYEGTKPNVIPVYDNSHRFQGYMAQGLRDYFDERDLHYLFVADDLLLNPILDEHSYAEHLRLTPEASFLPEFVTLHEVDHPWPRTVEAYQYRVNKPGAEVRNELPSYDEAAEAFKQHGLELKPLEFAKAFWPQLTFRGRTHQLLRRIKHRLKGVTYDLSYPLVGSYSDFVVVSAESIRQFCRYCGAFAATDLFVELAVPTAMVLSCKRLVTEKALTLQGKALWTDEERKILEPFDGRLKTLLASFPANHLYLHPIKLSKWNTEL
ncbi:MAG: hypothetical protein ABFE01_28985 [Phycisphaerales bacterium]